MISALKFNKAKDIFRAHGGILNTAKAIRLGIHPKTLYNMRDQGVLELLSRGLYRLSECSEIVQPDLIIISQKIPQGVICLISALSFHEITTQIPHKVDIAIPLKAHKPTPELYEHNQSGTSPDQAAKRSDGICLHRD
jgi:predicted transcriptional regulator of viral defense system